MSDDNMTCQQLVELITAYLDSVLDQQTRTRFDEHLRICYGCRSYLEQFRVTIRTVGTISADQLDPGFRDRLLDAFRDFR